MSVSYHIQKVYRLSMFITVFFRVSYIPGGVFDLVPPLSLMKVSTWVILLSGELAL